jgi:hypothetical protein
MAIAGPDGVDAAIKAGVDLDGTPIPAEMLALYNEVMELESQRARRGHPPRRRGLRAFR